MHPNPTDQGIGAGGARHTPMRSTSNLVAQTDIDADALEAVISGGGTTGVDWAVAGIILAAAIVVSRAVKLVVVRTVCRAADASIADLVGRMVAYAVVAFGFVYALDRLGVQIGPLLGALGIVGIALAFALRDILENFVAGLLLQFRRPFSYGDQIVSGDTEGTVESIDARSVKIITPDGETVYVPSSNVITQEIVNHTERGLRRTSLDLGVAYGTDLSMARTVLTAAVEAVDEVADHPEPEVLLTGFGASSIDFVVRFWHGPAIADRWRVRSEVAFALDRACTDHGIEIPFPQRVIWQAER